jgi:hypothetical protein
MWTLADVYKTNKINSLMRQHRLQSLSTFVALIGERLKKAGARMVCGSARRLPRRRRRGKGLSRRDQSRKARCKERGLRCLDRARLGAIQIEQPTTDCTDRQRDKLATQLRRVRSKRPAMEPATRATADLPIHGLARDEEWCSTIDRHFEHRQVCLGLHLLASTSRFLFLLVDGRWLLQKPPIALNQL